MKTIITIIFLISSLTASAKMNSTYAECIKLYGKSLSENSKNNYKIVMWQFKDYWIECIFYKNKVVIHSVCRRKPTFTEKEVLNEVNKVIGKKIKWKKKKSDKWAYSSDEYFFLADHISYSLRTIHAPKSLDKDIEDLNLTFDKEK